MALRGKTNIYLSYSITGKKNFREALASMEFLAKHMMESLDCLVWVPHVFTAGCLDHPKPPQPDGTPAINNSYLYALDITAAMQCDLVVAIVDSQSTGMGMEVQAATRQVSQQQILFVCEYGVKVSRMILGMANSHPRVECAVLSEPNETPWEVKITQAVAQVYQFTDQSHSHSAVSDFLEAKYRSIGWLPGEPDWSAMERSHNHLVTVRSQVGYVSSSGPCEADLWVLWLARIDAAKNRIEESCLPDVGRCRRIHNTHQPSVVCVERGPHYLDVMAWPV